MKPTLSIVVACYNAVGRVEDTLSSLSLQTAGPDDYEILVIDNNSKDIDHLSAFVDKLNERCPIFRLITENRPGLNHVRNRGASEAKASYVIYLDDDAVPLFSYVENVIRDLARYSPDVIGGSLLAFPEVPIGREYDFTFAGWWSLRHYGAKSRWLDKGEYFLGANIGAKRSILLEIGFNPELDRKGNSLIGGGEIWLGHHRYKRWYCAGAPVFHKVSKARTEIPYLAKRLAYNCSRNVVPGDWRVWCLFILKTFTNATKTWFLTISLRLQMVFQAAKIARTARKIG